MPAGNVIHPRLLDILRCPTSGLPLRIEGDDLVSTDGSRHYPVVAGIPCLVPDSGKPRHACVTEEDVVSFILAMIVSTCGNLFRGTKLKGLYPIPDFPNVFGADN